MIRVVLADDQALVRAGFRVVVESAADIEIVAEAANGLDAVDSVRRERPDVALLDIRMPQLDGLQAARRILALDKAPRVLLLTTFDLDDYVDEALAAGVSGYLLKDIEPDELVAAIRAAHAGEMRLAPSVTRRLVEHYVNRPIRALREDRIAALTPRERDVLTAIGHGRTNAEIVAEFHLSLSTVKTHVTAILAKLQLRDRVEAAILAHECGLVGRTRGDLEKR